jgi:predicted PurR-regulated permease PerM
MVLGICTFFASLFAGLLWTYYSVQAPFIFGSIMAIIANFLFIVLKKINHKIYSISLMKNKVK